MIGSIREVAEVDLTPELLNLYHQMGEDRETKDIRPETLLEWYRNSKARGSTTYVYMLQKERIGDATSFDCFMGALGTLVVDEKLIHGHCRAGRIEEVIVDKNHRGLGLGKSMVKFLVRQAKKMGCYKVSLSCKDDLRGFYEQSGFSEKDRAMEIRF